MDSKSRTLQSDLLLLLTAMIWGFAFVAQRAGMNYVGPFIFNAVRFALGALALLPFYFFRKNNPESAPAKRSFGVTDRKIIPGSLFAGVAVFAGASLQQIGIVYTTAGKAGFITGLYVIIVPIIGLLRKYPTGAGTWVGAVLATVGLYLLSVRANFTIAFGDLLVFIGAFFWAAHVHIISWLTDRISALRIAIIQFSVCSLFSFLAALLMETVRWQALGQAAAPILYAGILSVGVAYTLQVVAQKDAPPAHAAILLSLESVFAVLGGWLILSETLPLRGMIGAALMLAGMVASQVNSGRRE